MYSAYLSDTNDYLPTYLEEDNELSFNLNYTGNLRNHKYYTLVAERDGSVLGWIDFTECSREISIQSIETSANNKEDLIEELMKHLKTEFPNDYVVLDDEVKESDIYESFNTDLKKQIYLNEARSIIRSVIEDAKEK